MMKQTSARLLHRGKRKHNTVDVTNKNTCTWKMRNLEENSNGECEVHKATFCSHIMYKWSGYTNEPLVPRQTLSITIHCSYNKNLCNCTHTKKKKRKERNQGWRHSASGAFCLTRYELNTGRQHRMKWCYIFSTASLTEQYNRSFTAGDGKKNQNIYISLLL